MSYATLEAQRFVKVTKEMATGTITEDLNYETLPLWFLSCLKGDVTSAETALAGQSASYEWSFIPSLTSSNAQKSLTVSYSDLAYQYLVTSALISKVTMSFSKGQMAQNQMDLIGNKPMRSAASNIPVKVSGQDFIASGSAQLTLAGVDVDWISMTTTIDSGQAELGIGKGLQPQYGRGGTDSYVGSCDVTLYRKCRSVQCL